MPLTSIGSPVRELQWAFDSYIVGLHATAFIVVLALLDRLARPRAVVVARLWTLMPPALLAMTLLCYMPGGWVARIVPGPLAGPMRAIGGARTDARVGAELANGAVLAATAVHVLWIAGVLVVLGRLAHGWHVVRSTARRAAPVDCPVWGRALTRARRRAGFPDPIDLRRSTEVTSPFACGVLAPSIVLPAESEGWTTAERDAVLLHEVAHLKRRDLAVQCLAQIACAWYWWNPLIWWASARLRAMREYACDAEVLASGVRPAEYAEALLQLAAGTRRGRSPGPALAFLGQARSTHLGARLRAVLDPERRRLDQAPVRYATATFVVVVLVVALGTVRLMPQRRTTSPANAGLQTAAPPIRLVR